MGLRDGMRVRVVAPDPADGYDGFVGRTGTVSVVENVGDCWDCWVRIDGHGFGELGLPFATSELAPIDEEAK